MGVIPTDSWITGLICFSITLVSLVMYKRLSKEPECESWIEQRLYNALARKGYLVRKQVRCGPFRIDMVVGNIAIECDGKAFHSSPDQKSYDRRRSAYLYRHGYKSVIRFTGSQINRDTSECVRQIEKKLFKGVV